MKTIEDQNNNIKTLNSQFEQFKQYEQQLTEQKLMITQLYEQLQQHLENDKQKQQLGNNQQEDKKQSDQFDELKKQFCQVVNISNDGIIDPQKQYGEKQFTFALWLASNGVIPSKEWEHDPNIKNVDNLTVNDYLKTKNIDVPQQWQINN